MSSWVSKYLKDSNYKIVKTTPDGNCFFESVEKALANSNKKFDMNTIMDFRRYLHKIVKKSNYDRLVMLFNELKAVDPSSNAMDELLYLDKIGNFKEFKDAILTNSFWANNWAINELEKELKVKFIILSEAKYRENEKNVLQCTNTEEENTIKCSICGIRKDATLTKEEEKNSKNKHREQPWPTGYSKDSKPSGYNKGDHYWESVDKPVSMDYVGYIMVTYRGDHYDNIAYNDQLFFKNINDLPKSMLDLIEKNCPNMINKSLIKQGELDTPRKDLLEGLTEYGELDGETLYSDKDGNLYNEFKVFVGNVKDFDLDEESGDEESDNESDVDEPVIPVESNSEKAELFDDAPSEYEYESSDNEPEETTADEPEETIDDEPVEDVPDEPVADDNVDESEPVEDVDEPVETIADEPEETIADEPEETIDDEPEETIADEPEEDIDIPDEPVADEPEEITNVPDEPEEITVDEPEKPKKMTANNLNISKMEQQCKLRLSNTSKTSNNITNDEWSDEHTNKYIRGYIEKGHKNYDSINNAKTDGSKNKRVTGITFSPRTKKYTLRKGIKLLDSPSGESSWTKLSKKLKAETPKPKAENPKPKISPKGFPKKKKSKKNNWSKEHHNKFLKGYIEKGHKKYDLLNNAKSNGANNNRVGGITLSPRTKKYTLRKGTQLLNSPTKEKSWLKQ